VQDVPTAQMHICSQQSATFFMYDLNVGREFSRKVAHGAWPNLNATALAEFCADFFNLAAFQKSGDADVRKDIICMIGSRCDNAL
jgi:hypothetical protein